MKSITRTILGLVGVLLCSSALSLSLSCTGGGGVGQTLKTWSGAFAGCEREDLGQLVTSGEVQMTLLQDVSLLLQDDGAQLEADLSALGVAVTVEAVHCAILAAENVLAPAGAVVNGTPIAAAEGSGSATRRVVPTPATLEGIARARTWLATQATQAPKTVPSKKGK